MKTEEKNYTNNLLSENLTVVTYTGWSVHDVSLGIAMLCRLEISKWYLGEEA